MVLVHSTLYHCKKYTLEGSAQSDMRCSGQAENAVKMIIKGKNRRQHKLELWFLCTTLSIIPTNTNTMFEINRTGYHKVMLLIKN